MSIPSSSIRNQANAFPPFAPGVSFRSVYERAGFDVNKSLYSQVNDSQSSIRSGRSNRSNRSQQSTQPNRADFKAPPLPSATPQAIAHPVSRPGGSFASQGKDNIVHGESAAPGNRPTVSVSPRLDGTKYPFYHRKSRQSSLEDSGSDAAPPLPNSQVPLSPTKTATLPTALQFTPPPKAVGKGILSRENTFQSPEVVPLPHNRQGSGGTDISMISSLTASSATRSEASDGSGPYSNHTSSFTDTTSWDSESQELSNLTLKQNLLVPQHLDNRFSTTSSIYSMNPTMDHITEPALPDLGYSLENGQISMPKPPAEAEEPAVVGLGVQGVELEARSTVAAAPATTNTTGFRQMRASVRNYTMSTPPLEIHKETVPTIPTAHPNRGTSMESTTSFASSRTGFSSATNSNPVPLPRGAKICRGCSQVITKKGIRSREGNLSGRWHRECFKCTECKDLLNGEVYVLADTPYCGQCYHEANHSTCRGCGKGVEGECMETRAEDGSFASYIRYHYECLRCVDCQCLLHDSYYVVDGGNYCYSHAIEAQPANTQMERRYTRFAMI